YRKSFGCRCSAKTNSIETSQIIKCVNYFQMLTCVIEQGLLRINFTVLFLAAQFQFYDKTENCPCHWNYLYFHFPNFSKTQLVAGGYFGVLQNGNCRGTISSVHCFDGKT